MAKSSSGGMFCLAGMPDDDLFCLCSFRSNLNQNRALYCSLHCSLISMCELCPCGSVCGYSLILIFLLLSLLFASKGSQSVTKKTNESTLTQWQTDDELQLAMTKGYTSAFLRIINRYGHIVQPTSVLVLVE